MKKIKVLLAGAGGRMGTIISDEIKKYPDIYLMVKLEADEHPGCAEKKYLPCANVFSYLEEFKNGQTQMQPLREQVDVVIDFSTPEAAVKLLREAHLPSVIGVTGFTNKQLAEIKEISKTVPVVQDYNFSTGVCVMTAAAENMARIFGVEYDVEISEIHHGEKVDAPSGTAIKLAKNVAKGREQNYEEVVRMSREGKVGARPVGEIGIQALRIKGVVGEHTVHFGGPNERLEITHKAGSRAVFAEGAVRSAKWVVNQPPGLYTYRDVLGL